MSADHERPLTIRERGRAQGAGLKKQMRGAGIGFEIAISIILGLYFGQLCDEQLGSEPVGALIGFFFGLGAASRALYRLVKAEGANKQRENARSGQMEMNNTLPEEPTTPSIPSKEERESLHEST